MAPFTNDNSARYKKFMFDDKYKNKYRIDSTRLKGWDYSSEAFYFVTICTKNQELFFGDVINGQMHLSEIGKIANEFWLKIPKSFPIAKLHEHIIMPNHAHGIILIDHSCYGHVETRRGNSVAQMYHVETRRGASLRGAVHKRQFGPLQKNSISSIINHYKGAVTKWCKKNYHEHFAWQKGFHDRIIRNEEELYKKRIYIIDNPFKWESDRNNPGRNAPR